MANPSQITRQATVVVKDDPDPKQVTENLALYTEDGTPVDLAALGSLVAAQSPINDDFEARIAALETP